MLRVLAEKPGLGSGILDPSDPFCQNNDYTGVWGSGPSDVWAVFENDVANRVGFAHFDGATWSVTDLLVPAGTLQPINVSSSWVDGRHIWGTGPDNIVAIAGGVELTRRDGHWQYARIDDDGSPSSAVAGTAATGLLVASSIDGLVRWKPEGIAPNLPQTPPYEPSSLTFGLASHAERFVESMQTSWTAAATDETGRPWLLGSGPLPLRNASDPQGQSVEIGHLAAGAVVRDGTVPLWGATSIAVASDGHLWVTGSTFKAATGAWGSAIAERRNGVWTTQPTDTALVELWSPGGDEVWGVGDKGAIVRYRNGALEHHDIPNVSLSYVAGVHGTGRDDVWFLGYETTTAAIVIAHWDGATLRKELSEPNNGTSSNGLSGKLWAAGPGDVWLPGKPGAHLVNGRLSRVQPDGDGEIAAVWGRGTTDVWVATVADFPFGVGYGNYAGSTLRHFDGTTFDVRGPKVSGRINGITGTATATWAAGRFGAVLELPTQTPTR